MIDLTEFEKLVLPDVLHCPGYTVTHAVKQSIVDFCEKTWLFSKSFNKVLIATDINSDINDYVDIDVGEYVTDKVPIAIAEFRINGILWDLKYIELENDSNYELYLRETNEKMFSFPDNATVRIHEMTSGEELFLKVIYKPTYEIEEIDDIIYNDWIEPVAAGAKSRLLMIPGQPWTNGELAVFNEMLYKRGVSEARRKVQKNFTKGQQHVRWRTFGE